MEFITFRGFNCYHECVAGIAHTFGISCVSAFASLWPETDFRYDPIRMLYLSKKMIANFAVLGAKAESFACTGPNDVAAQLDMLDKDALFVVGMDAFYLPWHQFYQMFHGIHYFIAQHAKTDALPCFDPTYRIQEASLSRESIIAHTVDIVCVSPVAKNPLPANVKADAAEILRCHPDTRRVLPAQIETCAQQPHRLVALATYIDTLISNRSLYRAFLQAQPLSGIDPDGFSDAYFLEWAAVKNGLYKASLVKNRDRILQKVRTMLETLLDQELEIAEKIGASTDFASGIQQKK